MKPTQTLSLLAATLLISSASLHAADLDDRIESFAKKSYVFKTHLKHDSIMTVGITTGGTNSASQDSDKR